ncbi:MAG: protein kinase [Myxococcota bacterium]
MSVSSSAGSGSGPGSGPNASSSRSKRRDRLIGTSLDGKYKIIKKIGEGGMGSVYIANQESIDRKVAVKVLLSKLAEDEIAVKRFQQEARAISKMSHPNTVTIYDFGQVEETEDEGQKLYIVMEYLKGATLTQVLRKEGALTGPRASRIMRQICASLSDAHGAGIIHRDLKPDNIFLSELGVEKDFVKVLDFGVAKLADSEHSGTLTQTGMIFGTPKYMSPEQAEGKPIDYRADIYALGVVLYELLSGKPPFVADTPVGLLLKHISEPPRPFAEVAAERNVDPRLERIVMRALEKHPDRRQQQVTELAGELEDYERAATGPQRIPTDIGSLSGSPAHTASTGLPTEMVPGTMSGQPVTPAGLVPPDQVPPDLSAGLAGSASGVTGAPGPNTRAATVGAGHPGAPMTAPGITAPMVGASGQDTLGSGLSGGFSGEHNAPRKTPAGMIAAVAGALVLIGGVGYAVTSGGGPQVQRLERELAPAPLASDQADQTPPGLSEAEGEPAARPVAETPTAGRGSSDSERSRPSRPSKPSVSSPTVQREAEVPSQVIFRLRSTPSRAVVSVGGRQAGITPFQYRAPRGDENVTFTFRKKGYRPTTTRASSEADRTVEVTLRKARRPKPATQLCPNGQKPPCATKSTDLKVDDLK